MVEPSYSPLSLLGAFILKGAELNALRATQGSLRSDAPVCAAMQTSAKRARKKLAPTN